MIGVRRDRRKAIRIGGSITLYPIKDVVEQWGGAMSLVAFRKFCQNLSVTLWEFGNTTYVDVFQLEAHMNLMMHQLNGERFVAPGAKSVKDGRRVPTILNAQDESVRRNWKTVLKEMWLKRKLNKGDASREARVRLREIENRLFNSGIHVKAKKVDQKIADRAGREVTFE